MSNLTSASGDQASVSSHPLPPQQQQKLVAAAAGEIRSNLTSASGDQASVSSHPLPPPPKKRSLAGNPDPDAEVIALSPRTLMSTNRHVCEICFKGFQSEQNLQLHRRGHNLPWKLKQRNPKEVVRKKVYVCPEPGCVHHDPPHALGDLTGIKKHFSRKHGEKKWKCDKCSKRYAVHSDWKAHSKVCGTREYRCDCGTLFSRRDSFITHRAFCDALAEESATAVAGQHPGLLFSHGGGGGGSGNAGLQLPSVLDPSQQVGGHGLIQEPCLKREQQQQFAPSWLTAQQQQLELAGAGSSAMFGSSRLDQEFIGCSTPESSAQLAGLSFGSFSSSATSASAHMSATALLQNAAQMGATLSRPSSQGHMANMHNTSATTNVATTDAATAATSNVMSTAVGADYGLAFASSHVVADVCPERVDALQTGMMVAPAHHRERQKHQQHHHHHHLQMQLHGEEHHQLQQHQKQQRTAQESMDEAPICALGGAMFKLPGKLDGLLRQGYMLPKGAEDEIPLIKRDLEEIVAILQDHISRSEDPSVMVNCWMKEVRELSYDIEDCIDHYQHAADSAEYVCRIPRRKFTTHKTNRLPERLKQRLWMANKIREFSARVQEALQRHEMYNLGGISRATPPTYDVSFRSPHHIVHGEAAYLVGIDAHMNKLEEWLIKDGDQKLKVVSIVGVGGIGKTTLAKELSSKLEDQFDCRAFVRASHKPDMRRLLISMLSQVRPHHPPDTWKVHNLIADIRTHLQDKRYLIIVDDVRATSTLDVVNCALPDDNRSSRILLLTDIEDVAHKCCGYDSKYVFMMKPLGDDDSRKLFFNTVFGPKHECPPELAEVSNSIIRKCGGFPLASVTIASLLARQMGKPEQWDYVNKSLGYGLRTNTTLEGMKLVLNLSYNNLPHHLKACMLYLSIYEHDYVIWKDDLVKQWIAEGFICATEEQDKEEISGSYFDELVSRRMIQPVHINDNDEVLSCIVHHMVLNLITYNSIEENFAIAIDHSQTTIRLADKVHRLSLHFGNAEDATPPTNMRLAQVRTLAFWGVFKCMPSIVEFRLLQVLILHFWGDEESVSFDLTRISELFRLRYLQVTCNVTLELRTQMRGLQYLETLKIDARVSAIPSDIVHLPGLLHLNLPAETNLPNGIGHMTSLRTLGYFDLGCNSIENVQSLGELTNLRDLQLTCYNIQPHNLKNMQCLGSILGKLSSLKSITLVLAGSSNVNTLDVARATSMCISGDGLSSVSSPPFLLRRLELLPRVCIFSSLPKWIRHLCKLCILKIGVRELARNVVDVLRGLPALTVLSLYVHTKPAERIVFDKVGFSVLKYFKFRCSVAWLKFGAGAMPNLRKLKLGFNAHAVDRDSTTIPVGIEHLSGLKEISAKIGGASAEEPDGRSAESALSDVIRMHPGRPNVNIQCVDRMFGGKDDESSGTQEEEHMALQKQYEIMEQNEVQEPEPMLPAFLFPSMTAGAETDCVTASPFISPERSQSQVTISDSIQLTAAHKKRKALPEQSTRVRVSAGQDEGPPDDGFSWRKYGPKDIPGDKYPRIYMSSESSSHLPIPDAEHGKVESKQASDVEDAMVSSSTGAMNSLLKKHAILMGEEYAKLRGTRKEVMILKDELGAMNALLEKLADMDELNFQMKDWRNQMREMTYVIEDCIDDLMLQFDKDNAKPYYIHQPTAYPEKWDVLQKFILQIQILIGKGDLGSMVHKTEVQILGSSYMATESRLPAVYDKAVGLVGMDGQRDELVQWMMDGEQQQKVVCILGPGGLGKTTLAKEVYNKIEAGRFGHRVFVPVPQKINITRLLGNILSTSKELYGSDMKGLSNAIRRRLQPERYLIVLDGVWSVEIWKYIQRALPENNRASRIIITTNIRDVAESCVRHSSDFIYHMRPLHPDDSYKLFRSIIFGSERSCPDALGNVGDKILEACGGIPLAIIIIAGFLANKPTEVAQWEMVEKRMDPAEKGDLTTEGMKKIFHICYSDLPRHMKSCLLYLSVFPGNHVIRKDRVIWRWITEGFIPRRGEESLWETGESYFQELICRKLIEPAYGDEEDDDVPTSCKVHGVILEFITSLSNEENFVTTDAKTTYMQHGVIRRLTVNYSNKEEDGAFWPITEDLSKVRSLTISGVVQWDFPSLKTMHFLRVLDLEDIKNLRNRHLEGIGRLVLLRYLGLRGTGIEVLPEEIGELQNLETLDLRWTCLMTLPASIVRLRKLVRLLLDVNRSSSLDLVAELLIKSKRLRMLGVRWGRGAYYRNALLDETNFRSLLLETAETSFRSFIKEVGKSNIQSLLLEDCLLDVLLDSWVPPQLLRRFELTIFEPLEGVPPKMASLANLTHLRISITRVEAEGLRVLGDLPNLILLKLETRFHAVTSRHGLESNSSGFHDERILVTSRHGFRCLMVFSYKCTGMGLQFTPGAMPQLRMLRIEFSARNTEHVYGNLYFGIQHLSCLTRIHAAIRCWDEESEVEAAEAAITEQVSKNPNSPVLELSRESRLHKLF